MIQLLTRDTHFIFKDTNRLKVNGWKKMHKANRSNKKAGVIIVISDKIDLTIKLKCC